MLFHLTATMYQFFFTVFTVYFSTQHVDYLRYDYLPHQRWWEVIFSPASVCR